MSAVVPFKMFGLQRSCTNLIVHLMKRNFSVTSTERGGPWKHGYLRKFPFVRNGQAVRLLVCVKDPYAWLDSFYRWCSRHVQSGGMFGDPGLRTCGFVCGCSFAEFIHRPCYDHETPIEHWNAMYRHWLGLTADPRLLHVVRAEQLYSSQEQRATLRRIQAAFGLQQLQHTLHVQTNRVAVNERVAGRAMDAGFYVDRRYLERFSPNLISFVSGKLDAALLTRLGYERHPNSEARQPPTATLSGQRW